MKNRIMSVVSGRLSFVRCLGLQIVSENAALPEQPGGLPAISRGARSAERDDTPGQRSRSEASWRDASNVPKLRASCWHPSRVRSIRAAFPGVSLRSRPANGCQPSGLGSAHAAPLPCRSTEDHDRKPIASSAALHSQTGSKRAARDPHEALVGASKNLGFQNCHTDFIGLFARQFRESRVFGSPLQPLLMAVPGGAFGQHFSVQVIERGKEGDGAVAVVVMGAGGDVSLGPGAGRAGSVPGPGTDSFHRSTGPPPGRADRDTGPRCPRTWPRTAGRWRA